MESINDNIKFSFVNTHTPLHRGFSSFEVSFLHEGTFFPSLYELLPGAIIYCIQSYIDRHFFCLRVIECHFVCIDVLG